MEKQQNNVALIKESLKNVNVTLDKFDRGECSCIEMYRSMAPAISLICALVSKKRGISIDDAIDAYMECIAIHVPVYKNLAKVMCSTNSPQ